MPSTNRTDALGTVGHGERILVVDDEKLIRWTIAKSFGEAGYAIEEASTGAEALAAVERELPDLVLLDFKLPDRTGVEILREIRRASPEVPVILITAFGTLEGAVAAMREGAYDYRSKPFEIDDLLLTVRRALEASGLRDEVRALREETRRATAGAGPELVAESAPMKEVVRLIDRVAQSEASTILLLGESGVGKGVVARVLHDASRRSSRSFLNITCTALPENLLESELFGHERGAFTDARQQKRGLVELAQGGSLFLDEIGDLSPALQGKILRFLEAKQFRRVGGTRDITVSVRIIAATNRDLSKEVNEGRFREDLFYRLNVIPIKIPPLRERREDLRPLVERFITHFGREFKKHVRGFDPEALDVMESYHWPGNVRQLRNAIERSVLLADHDTLSVEDLPVEVRTPPPGGAVRGAARNIYELPAEGAEFDLLEREYVRQALERTKGNRSRAARLLGMNRDQIRYRLEKFGFEKVGQPPNAEGDAINDDGEEA
ncbi:MAG: sigma-54-dependent Fis family transcriptional regulator [Planctomycetes bacterium]|nr:sigma-54-dependent Fis family transcriptional regulator [Planctomycetota bacterium]